MTLIERLFEKLDYENLTDRAPLKHSDDLRTMSAEEPTSTG